MSSCSKVERACLLDSVVERRALGKEAHHIEQSNELRDVVPTTYEIDSGEGLR